MAEAPLTQADALEAENNCTTAKMSHVVMLPKGKPVIRRKRLTAAEARAAALQGPLSPIGRTAPRKSPSISMMMVERSPSVSSFASEDSSCSSCCDYPEHPEAAWAVTRRIRRPGTPLSGDDD